MGRTRTAHQQLVEVLAARGGPANADAPRLGDADGKQEGLPEDGRLLGLHLLEVVDGWACNSTGICDELVLEPVSSTTFTLLTHFSNSQM